MTTRRETRPGRQAGSGRVCRPPRRAPGRSELLAQPDRALRTASAGGCRPGTSLRFANPSPRASRVRNKRSVRLALFIAFLLLPALSLFRGRSQGLYALVDTSKGRIIPRLPHEKAPVRSANFVALARGSAQTRTREQARELAERILARARRGEDFAELAPTYSDSPSAREGGWIGQIARGMTVPALDHAAFPLEIDEVSNVTSTPGGFRFSNASGKQAAVLRMGMTPQRRSRSRERRTRGSRKASLFRGDPGGRCPRSIERGHRGCPYMNPSFIARLKPNFSIGDSLQ